jgi:hypothetical protein
MRLSALVPAALVSFACASPPPTFHQDVRPILEGRCTNCHVSGGVGPFALDTYSSVKAMGAAVVDSTQKGRMPPWLATGNDVGGYLRDPSLTPEQKDVLARWVAAGMPEGDAKKPGVALEPVATGLPRVDVTLKMPEPYTPRVVPDDYRCFVLRWPRTTPSYVTGINGVPGNSKIVHHVALYLVDGEAAKFPPQWDAEDAVPGYECFGGPFGNRPQQFPVKLLTAWLPGYQGQTFPRGGGVLVPPGSTVVLQMHYSSLEAAPGADQTAMEFSLADTVTRRLAYQPFLKFDWVAGQMPIPANATEVVHEHKADPRPNFGLLGSPLDTSKGFNLEAVMFHMHTMGRRGELWLHKADKTRVKVLEIPRWDFHWQQEYQLKEPVRFSPGDELRVRCVFENTGPNAKMSNWGENSDEEMCVANLLSSE